MFLIEVKTYFFYYLAYYNIKFLCWPRPAPVPFCDKLLNIIFFWPILFIFIYHFISPSRLIFTSFVEFKRLYQGFYRKIKISTIEMIAAPIMGASFRSKRPPDVDRNGSRGSRVGEARWLISRSHLFGFIGKSGILT